MAFIMGMDFGNWFSYLCYVNDDPAFGGRLGSKPKDLLPNNRPNDLSLIHSLHNLGRSKTCPGDFFFVEVGQGGSRLPCAVSVGRITLSGRSGCAHRRRKKKYQRMNSRISKGERATSRSIRNSNSALRIT